MPSNGYDDMILLDHTGSHWIPIRINKDSQNHCLLKTLKEIGHHLLQQRSEDTHLVHPVEKKRPLKAALVKLFEAKEFKKKIKPKGLLKRYGYGSIPINTIFSGMNIHLPAILMFTRGTRF